MSTCTWIIVLPVIIIALGAIQLRTALATANESTSGNENGYDERETYPTIKNLTVAWIEKPPYITSPTNESPDDEGYGMLTNTFLQYVFKDCGALQHVFYRFKPLRADSEEHMIELLRQKKAHVAAPIFESTNRWSDEGFSFYKFADYPGSEFITSEVKDKLNLVLKEVLESWPLFVVTLILTAIAGVIMWALVSFT